jgi:alanine racemase
VLHARTWAEVDLSALERNLARVRAAAGGAAVMLVVKADAYGHGAVPVSWHLLPHGVASLGVGDSQEALTLRAAGVTAPIVVLGAIVPGEMEDVIRGGIGVTVHSSARVRALARAAERTGAVVKVHLKVDTGMGRLGCAPERAPAIAREIRRSSHLRLEGVATHLASPGPEGARETERQLARFRRVVDVLEADGIRPPWRHAYSSGGVLSLPPGEFNLVRPGLAVYGVAPVAPQGGAPALEPALSWRTQVVFLRDHRRGARIGYGGTWRAPGPCRIATLPVGYNDGYRFAFSNKAHVLVRGTKAPVVGRVSMDYVTVDVTHVPGVRVDDEVTLVGRDGDERIGVEDLAGWAQTIPYEILCGLGRRVQRAYRSSAAAPAVPAARAVPASAGASLVPASWPPAPAALGPEAV